MKYGIFRRARKQQDSFDLLYGAIVAQARLPAFYRSFAVPDTVNGRLEMILLHVFLLSRRTGAGASPLGFLSQDVFDLFCDDMDANLREIGIGDLAVPKHMRRIGEAFYGRAAAYNSALAVADDSALSEALIRNVFDGVVQGPERALRLASYIRAAEAQLAREGDANLAEGRISFPDPGSF